MGEPDQLAQFLENAAATDTYVRSYVTPAGIFTITIEFEPYEEEVDQ